VICAVSGRGMSTGARVRRVRGPKSVVPARSGKKKLAKGKEPKLWDIGYVPKIYCNGSPLALRSQHLLINESIRIR